MGRFTTILNEKLKLTDKFNYPREQYQSFMTGPEWRNVEMAEEYAAFLSAGRSMFKFPYFRQVFDLWKVIYHSFKAAKKYDNASKIIASEYMLMDILVGTFSTFELIPKGIMSLFSKPFLRHENKTEMQKHFAAYYEKYAKDLQTLPFYDHHYAEIKKDLAEKFHRTKKKTVIDWCSWQCIAAELTAKKYISKPFHYWFHQENNLVTATTDVIVKFNAETEDEENAKAQFQNHLAKLDDAIKPAIVNEIYTKANPEKNYTSVYAQLRASRYGLFRETVTELGNEGIALRKIAGQDQVQVKCKVSAENKAMQKACEEHLSTLQQPKLLYSYGNRIDHNRMCLFDVPVKNLHQTVAQLNAEENTAIKFIHNF